MDPTTGLIASTGIASVVAAVSAVWVGKMARKSQNDDALLKWATQLQASEKAAREETEATRKRTEVIRQETEKEVRAVQEQIGIIRADLSKAQGQITRLNETLSMASAEVARPEPDIRALRRLLSRDAINGQNWQTF